MKGTRDYTDPVVIADGLLNTLFEDTEWYESRYEEALDLLGRFTDEQWRRFLQLWRDEDWAPWRYHFAIVLGNFPEQGWPTLVEMLMQERDDAVLSQVVQSLCNITSEDIEAGRTPRALTPEQKARLWEVLAADSPDPSADSYWITLVEHRHPWPPKPGDRS